MGLQISKMSIVVKYQIKEKTRDDKVREFVASFVSRRARHPIRTSEIELFLGIRCQNPLAVTSEEFFPIFQEYMIPVTYKTSFTKKDGRNLQTIWFNKKSNPSFVRELKELRDKYEPDHK